MAASPAISDCVVPMLHQDLQRDDFRGSYFCQISEAPQLRLNSGRSPTKRSPGVSSRRHSEVHLESDASIVAPRFLHWSWIVARTAAPHARGPTPHVHRPHLTQRTRPTLPECSAHPATCSERVRLHCIATCLLDTTLYPSSTRHQVAHADAEHCRVRGGLGTPRSPSLRQQLLALTIDPSGCTTSQPPWPASRPYFLVTCRSVPSTKNPGSVTPTHHQTGDSGTRRADNIDARCATFGECRISAHDP